MTKADLVQRVADTLAPLEGYEDVLVEGEAEAAFFEASALSVEAVFGSDQSLSPITLVGLVPLPELAGTAVI